MIRFTKYFHMKPGTSFFSCFLPVSPIIFVLRKWKCKHCEEDKQQLPSLRPRLFSPRPNTKTSSLQPHKQHMNSARVMLKGSFWWHQLNVENTPSCQCSWSLLMRSRRRSWRRSRRARMLSVVYLQASGEQLVRLCAVSHAHFLSIFLSPEVQTEVPPKWPWGWRSGWESLRGSPESWDLDECPFKP